MGEAQSFVTQGVRVCVEGCGHGTLDAIYAVAERSRKERKWDGIDLVIIGGDFQAVRNSADLLTMSVPAKYRKLGDFPAYYSGHRKAPYLTLFIGGNHESAAHLWELYHGGWVAPNIYYLGTAGVVRVGPLRIAGMSGIWKSGDYGAAHHERQPFSCGDIRSFYHVREEDVRRLLLLREPVDVGLSHDWPRGIERWGDERRLFRMKSDFEHESRDGTLGNPAAAWVMDRLRPAYWFSAHLHCMFSAIKYYAPGQAASWTQDKQSGRLELGLGPDEDKTAVVHQANPDEIELNLDDGDGAPGPAAPLAREDDMVETEALRSLLPAAFAKPQPQHKQHQAARQTRSVPGQPPPPTITNTAVRFLCLDKCLPGRKFLKLCELQPLDPADLVKHPPAPAAANGRRYRLRYDPEWLAITRVFAHVANQPDLGEAAYAPLIDAERAWVEAHVVREKGLDVPENFVLTAPPDAEGPARLKEYTNPQTEAFCRMLGIANRWDASEEERERRMRYAPIESEIAPWRGGHGGGAGGRFGSRGGRGGGWDRGKRGRRPGARQ